MNGEHLSPTQALSRSFVLPESSDALHDGAGESLQRYGFSVSGYWLFHDLSRPLRLSELPATYGLPNTQSWFLGLCNLRGNLVPVFDLGEFLRPEDSPAAAKSFDPVRRQLLVSGSGSAAGGIVVDTTPVHMVIAPTAAVDSSDGLPGLVSGAVQATYRHQGETWYELDYGDLFTSLAQHAEV